MKEGAKKILFPPPSPPLWKIENLYYSDSNVFSRIFPPNEQKNSNRHPADDSHFEWRGKTHTVPMAQNPKKAAAFGKNQIRTIHSSVTHLYETSAR